MRASRWGFAIWLVGASAHAQAAGIDLPVEGECPSTEALRHAREPLSPGARLTIVPADAPAGAAARARVRDLGERHAIEAGDARREIGDAA